MPAAILVKVTFNDYDPSAFPPFAVTTDLVILTVRRPGLHVLLVTRQQEPFVGVDALPGGFVGPDADLIDAARSTLTVKSGVAVDAAHLEQLGSFGHPDRDPRMRVVSVAHLAMLPKLPDPMNPAEPSAWVPVAEAKKRTLAFDHNEILSQGVERARAKLEYTTLALRFCAPQFTMTELRKVYEAVWGTTLDPANFHRKVLSTEDFVVDTGQRSSGGRGRPAKLYSAGSAAVLSPPIHR